MMAKEVDIIPKGTVIAIPITETTLAIGQVLEEGVIFYLGVDPSERETLPENICSASVKFQIFSRTTDGEIYKGNWKIIGQCEPFERDYPRPDYKVYRDGQLRIVSFDGQPLRDFEPGRDDHLQFESSQTPLLVQDAVRAYCGLDEWLLTYDKLLRPTK